MTNATISSSRSAGGYSSDKEPIAPGSASYRSENRRSCEKEMSNNIVIVDCTAACSGTAMDNRTNMLLMKHCRTDAAKDKIVHHDFVANTS